MLFKTEFMKQRGEVQTSGDDKLIDPDPISPGSFPELTADGGPLGQDGDGAHGGVLQLVDGAVLGPPAVGADPQEMSDLIGPLRGVQDSPAAKAKPRVQLLRKPGGSERRLTNCKVSSDLIINGFIKLSNQYPLLSQSKEIQDRVNEMNMMNLRTKKQANHPSSA